MKKVEKQLSKFLNGPKVFYGHWSDINMRSVKRFEDTRKAMKLWNKEPQQQQQQPQQQGSNVPWCIAVGSLSSLEPISHIPSLS